MLKPLGWTMAALLLGLASVGCGSKEAAAPGAAARGAGGKEMALDLGDKVTLKLIEIPAGTFLMGSPETELDRDDDETPHEVTISKTFFMGITDVTVDQFAAFAKDSGYKTDAEKEGKSVGIEIKDGELNEIAVAGCSWRNPGFAQSGDHPVVEVSWNDAQAFCGWLSKKSGRTVALPTEAQWEYACRAGTKTAFPWGDNPDEGKGWANCADQSLRKMLPNAFPTEKFSNWDDGFAFTAPVAGFKPNAFGLYDMNGNVWQWCQDRSGDYHPGAETDPAGPDTGDLRVQRGGSWRDDPAKCRSAYRDASSPQGRSGCDGFRVMVVAAAGGK